MPNLFAVTQYWELWPHLLQLPAKSPQVSSPASHHWSCSQHPQAAQSLLSATPETPTVAVSHHRGCHHSHAPPRMLCQQPRSSPMAGPQESSPEDPRHSSQEPRQVPSRSSGHSVSGRTSTPVPPQIKEWVCRGTGSKAENTACCNPFLEHSTAPGAGQEPEP